MISSSRPEATVWSEGDIVIVLSTTRQTRAWQMRGQASPPVARDLVVCTSGVEPLRVLLPTNHLLGLNLSVEEAAWAATTTTCRCY